MLNYQIIANVGCSCKLHGLLTNSTSNAVLFARGMSSVVLRLDRWRHELSDSATRPTARILRPMSHLRFYRAILSHECATLSRATKSQTLRLSSCTLRLCRIKAKFHYTDTDPTGPGSPTKSVHVVGYELYSTTRTRHGPDTDPTGPARTRTDFFAAKLRWVRAGPVGSV